MASPPIYVLILLFDLRSRSFSWLVFIYEHNNTWSFILFMFWIPVDLQCPRESIRRIGHLLTVQFIVGIVCHKSSHIYMS